MLQDKLKNQLQLDRTVKTAKNYAALLLATAFSLLALAPGITRADSTVVFTEIMLAPAITDSLVKRAVEAGFTIDWGDGANDSIVQLEKDTTSIGNWDTYGILTAMVRNLLDAEPEPISTPKSEAEFFSLCSGAVQELILELINVRTTGTSDYLSRSTLRQVRKPAVNDTLLRLLVRATR